MIFGDFNELAILKCVVCIFVDDGADETASVCAKDIYPDRKCLSGLQVAVLKFVRFHDEGEIGNVLILDYYVDEMRFRLSVQLSLSLHASDYWWCIVTVVNDSGAGCNYWMNRVRWCVIVVNDGTSSLMHPLGCTGGQDGLSADSWISHIDWFLVNVRVVQRCGRWWAQLLGNLFAKMDMAQ